MLKRIQFLLLYFFSLLLYFLFFRAVFLVYQYQEIDLNQFSEILLVFWYGIPLDLSFAAYLTVIPLILLAFSELISPHLVRPVFKFYTIGIIFLLCLLHIADLELYRNWGFRIDNSFFKYLKTPQEMWASSAAAPFLLLIILFALAIIPAFYLFNKLIDRYFKEFPSPKLYKVILMLLVLPTLILPIRGGFQLAPINQSIAYYSQQPVLNHAALNAPWNFMQSIVDGTDESINPFASMSPNQAKEILNTLYNQPNDSTIQYVMNDKPNVVFIVWESFTSSAVESLGGRKGATPEFEKLIKEGLLIDGMYASSSRSDKGLVAILSGYPSQGKQSIMNIPSKTQQLPSLAKSFRKAGYSSSYYYGGELEFANMKSYLVNTGYETIIGKEAFEEKDMNSKWGAHDGVVLNKLYEDLKNNSYQEPFFTTLFTLSSHEPFESPVEAAFPGEDEVSKFLSSMHYTDASIGDFIRKMKALPVYENTLFVITADHGHRLPEQVNNLEPAKYDIPFLMFGGALNAQGQRLERISSQTDIAASLLAQLNLPYDNFPWSKNIFNTEPKNFAVSTMNTGFLWMDSLGAICFDYQGQQYMYNSHPQADSVAELGKAHLQVSFQDYLNK